MMNKMINWNFNDMFWVFMSSILKYEGKKLCEIFQMAAVNEKVHVIHILWRNVIHK